MPLDIRLRDVIEADLPIFYEHQLDPVATRMAAFPSRTRRGFMRHWRDILADETITKQTILVDGEVAGNVVGYIQGGQRTIGYWLGRAYWGRGVATAALIDFLVYETTRPLFAHVAKHNVASRRVLEKCGFSVCGASIPFLEDDGEVIEEFIMKLDGRETTSG